MAMDKNYQFFMKTKMDSYIGEWVAICNQMIISHGHNPKQVFRDAKEKCPNKKLLFTRVPDKESMIF